VRRVLATAVALAALACASGGGSLPAPEAGAVPVDGEMALSFLRTARGFYGSIVKRRFNTLETFHDRQLREHFRDPDLFFDYYADLAQAFADAHFEKSRPDGYEIEEFLFEEPGRVRVQVRFHGDDDRPLRPDATALVRRDRWELRDGRWWVQPGTL